MSHLTPGGPGGPTSRLARPARSGTGCPGRPGRGRLVPWRTLRLTAASISARSGPAGPRRTVSPVGPAGPAARQAWRTGGPADRPPARVTLACLPTLETRALHVAQAVRRVPESTTVSFDASDGPTDASDGTVDGGVVSTPDASCHTNTDPANVAATAAHPDNR